MARTIRLTESELIRLVKRIIKEDETDFSMGDNQSPTQSKSCPTTVRKIMKKIVDDLTPEEMEAVAMAYEHLGPNRFENKVEDVLHGESLMESHSKSDFKKAIHKISKIAAFASTGFLGGVTLILPCFEGVDFLENPPSWLQDVVTYGIYTSLPLALASIVTLALTKEDEK